MSRSRQLRASRASGRGIHDAFLQEPLNEIFKTSSKYPNRLNSREGYCLEFKKSFNWANRAEYARAFAAFANTRGGYMVFGVKPRPHEMVGLQNKRFEEMDPATVTEFLCGCFDPDIEWFPHVHEFTGYIFGLIYVCESQTKPVICRKSTGNTLTEGEIYYRYRGRTTKIRYSELRAMIDAARKQEQELWLELFQRIARIGVTEAGIFDLSTGKVSGPGGTFIIDESLLPRLEFIREGAFSQTEGPPTIRIIGEAKVAPSEFLPPVREIVKTRGIRAPTIISDFLGETQVETPEEYIRQICFESSALLPVYYYMRLAKLTRPATVKLLQHVKSTAQAKDRLIRRLQGSENLSLPQPTETTLAGRKKLDFRERLLAQETHLSGDVRPADAKYLIQAMRTLSRDRVPKRYLRSQLRSLFERFYGDRANSQLTYELRYAICFLDKLWNADSVPGK